MGKISGYGDASQVISAGDVVVGNRGVNTKKFTPDEVKGVLDQAAATGNSVTGTAAETTLATITIPAGAMGANGKIEVKADFSYTNSANAKTLKIKLGGTVLWSGTPTSTAGLTVDLTIRNRGTANSQRWNSRHFLSSALAGVATGTAAIDMASAQTITITAQLAVTTETITLEGRDAVMSAKA